MALHPNAVRSPSTDFQALGTAPNDIFEILEGPNEGNYVIRAVVDNVLFLQQALLFNDPGPVMAQVRKRKEKGATFTAAIVIDQPLFNNGVAVFAGMDVSVA